MIRLDGVTEPGEDQVARAFRARPEDAHAVEPAVRRERANDPGAGGAVTADVAQLVLDDSDLVVLADDGRRARQRADEGVAGLDAAVDDTDVDSALASRRAPTPG